VLDAPLGRVLLVDCERIEVRDPVLTGVGAAAQAVLCSDVLVEDCEITAARHAVSLLGSNAVTISECTLESARTAVSSIDSDDTTVRACELGGRDFFGVSGVFSNGARCVVTDCTFAVDGVAVGCFGAGSTLEDSRLALTGGGLGVRASATSGARIEGNVFLLGGTAIEVYRGDDCAIVGNELVGCSERGIAVLDDEPFPAGNPDASN